MARTLISSLLLVLLLVQQMFPAVVVVIQPTAAGISYMVSEHFEGTGTPTDWTTSGTVDFDNVTNPLEGSQSCQINDSTSYTQFAITASSEVYVAGRINLSASTAVQANIVMIMDSAPASVARMVLHSGDLKPVAEAVGGTQSGHTATEINTTAGVATFWMVRYKKGSGANAECEVWVSTGSSWGSSVLSNNGTSTANAEYIRLNNNTGYNSDQKWDSIHVSTSVIPIGDL